MVYIKKNIRNDYKVLATYQGNEMFCSWCQDTVVDEKDHEACMKKIWLIKSNEFTQWVEQSKPTKNLDGAVDGETCPLESSPELPM